MSRLINKIATRRFVLAVANEKKNKANEAAPDVYIDGDGKAWDYSRSRKNIKQFTSVSVEFLESLDYDFRKLISDKINKMNLRGKTVK